MPSDRIFNQDSEKVKEEILGDIKIKPMSILSKLSEQEKDKNNDVVSIEVIDENKGDKFKRLAQIRVSRILDDIDILGNLASGNYEYTAEQIQKIFTVIIDELSKTREKFINHNTLRFTL